MAGEIILLLVVVWVFISLVVAGHASDNGKTKLWGLAVLIFGLFGLVGYAISLASD